MSPLQRYRTTLHERRALTIDLEAQSPEIATGIAEFLYREGSISDFKISMAFVDGSDAELLSGDAS